MFLFFSVYCFCNGKMALFLKNSSEIFCILHAKKLLNVETKKNLKKFLQAILNCNEALRLRPLSVRALLCRGALKYRISAYYHAINDLTDAIELDKRCALAYYNRAVCLHKTKAYQRALKVLLPRFCGVHAVFMYCLP